MGDAEFRDLVRRMRRAQKKWFNPGSRTQGVLDLSKSLERQVDRELERDDRPTLFPEDQPHAP